MSKFEEVNGELVCFLTDEDLSGADYKAKADRYEKALMEIRDLGNVVFMGNSHSQSTEALATIKKIATDALNAVLPDESGLEGK